MSVRVRFAPSPTGPLHIGGVRTALYNYLFAKSQGGTFILRIEDTDQSRFVSQAEKYIEDSLSWSGIIPDESPSNGGPFGPYRQSDRSHIYRPYAQRLIEHGHAYYAFDTPEELEAVRERARTAGSPNWQYNHITRTSMRNSLTLPQAETERLLQAHTPYVVRIRLERNEEIKFTDRVRGTISVNSNNLDDKVLFKSDGLPTYHLANVVDDHLMEVSHVIRGEEWLPSAPLHVVLYRYLGWEKTMPEFAHLPLILKPDGKGKLSKRDGDRLGFPVFPLNWTTDSGDLYPGFREQGYLPEAFNNLLAFLGWNPGTEQEIFSLEQLVQAFSLDRVGKAGARFDPDKAKWFNGQHLRQLTGPHLGKMLFGAAISIGLEPPSLDYCQQVAIQLKDRALFINDMLRDGKYFFTNPESFPEKAVRKRWKPETPELLLSLIEDFNKTDYSESSLEQAFKSFLTEHELSFGQLGPALRLALTGQESGPSLFAIMHLLGKNRTNSRIQFAIQNLSNA